MANSTERGMSDYMKVYADNLLTNDGTHLVMHHVFPEAHRRAVNAVVSAALERAAGICRDEKVSGETGTEGDIGYNLACDHCSESILRARAGDGK